MSINDIWFELECRTFDINAVTIACSEWVPKMRACWASWALKWNRRVEPWKKISCCVVTPFACCCWMVRVHQNDLRGWLTYRLNQFLLVCSHDHISCLNNDSRNWTWQKGPWNWKLLCTQSRLRTPSTDVCVLVRRVRVIGWVMMYNLNRFDL